MDITMLLLAITFTVLGMIIGDCSKWMINSTWSQKLLALLGGGALLTLGIILFGISFGML